MDLHFLAPDLRRLDELSGDALALSCHSDERPLSGVLGLVDWRMCGHISRLVATGFLSGAAGERCLLAGTPRLPFDKVFLFGAGPTFAPARALTTAPGTRRPRDEPTPADDPAPVIRRLCREMLDTMGAAKVRIAAMTLPGRHLGLVDPGHAMRLFLEVAAAGSPLEELTLIDSPEAQRAMRAALDDHRRRDRSGSAL